MAQKNEQLRLVPSTHVASALELATFGSPLGVYMACRRQADFEPNPDAPEKYLKASLRRWAGELLGRRFYRAPTVPGSGRLACVSGQVDGVTAEGQIALLLRMPKGDSPLWKSAVETSTLPLAEQLEAALLASMVSWEVQVAVVLEGRMHIMKYQPNGKMEGEVGSAIFGFYKNVGAGKIPSATDRDALMLKKLYPAHTADHLSWKTLSAEQRQDVEKWVLKNDEFNTAKAEAEKLKAKVVEIVGEHSGINVAGVGVKHFIERIDFKAKAAAPHAGTWKAIAEIHLKKLKPKSASALLAKYTPTDGARVLNWYEGEGKRPGQLGGPIRSLEERQRTFDKLEELRKANPRAGTPDFRLLGDLAHELATFDRTVAEAS